MRIRRLVRFAVPLIAVATCAVGITWGDDEVVGQEATTGYGLESELLIHMVTVGGVAYHTLSTSAAHAVEYRRTLATTIPWTVESVSDATMSYYKAIPGDQQTPNGRICCQFLCSLETYNYEVGGNGRCGGTGNSCRVCTQICSGDPLVCNTPGKWLAIID